MYAICSVLFLQKICLIAFEKLLSELHASLGYGMLATTLSGHFAFSWHLMNTINLNSYFMQSPHVNLDTVHLYVLIVF